MGLLIAIAITMAIVVVTIKEIIRVLEGPPDYFWEGCNAYLAGVQLDDCPFTLGEANYDEWCDGWRYAKEHDALTEAY